MKTFNTFSKAWRNSKISSKRYPVHTNFLLETSTETLTLGKRLLSDLDYLSQVVPESTKNAASRHLLEREVLSHSRMAKDRSRLFFGNVLKLVNHLKSAEVVDDVYDVWKDSLKSVKQISLAEAMAGVNKNKAVNEVLNDIEFPPELRTRITESVEELNAVMEFKNDAPCIKIPEMDHSVTVTSKRPGSVDKNIKDLLSKNSFSAVAEMFDQPEKIFADFVGSPSEQPQNLAGVDILDCVLGGSVISVKELTRQIREIEEVGLPVSRGEFAGGMLAVLILTIIGAILLVTGIILWSVCCSMSTGMPDMDEPLCEAAAIILCFGFAVMMVAIMVVGGVAAASGMLGLAFLAWGGATITGFPPLTIAIGYAADAGSGGDLGGE